MNTSIRFGVVGLATAMVLIYGCQDESKDGSPSALGLEPTTVFADDFSDGVRRDRWLVDDERNTRVDQGSTGPALVMGPTRARSATTITPSGRTEVRFDVAFPIEPGGQPIFRFSIDGSGMEDTFFELAFDHTGRVMILGFQVPFSVASGGDHSVLFAIDEFGDAHWFIDGMLLMSRPSFPVSPFGLGLQGSGSSGFFIDNVTVVSNQQLQPTPQQQQQLQPQQLQQFQPMQNLQQQLLQPQQLQQLQPMQNLQQQLLQPQQLQQLQPMQDLQQQLLQPQQLQQLQPMQDLQQQLLQPQQLQQLQPMQDLQQQLQQPQQQFQLQQQQQSP